VLKIELHAHTDLDPADRIFHSTERLVDRAAALGYQVLAVTPHDRYFDPRPYASYARDRGVLLLSGIERTISGRHVLLVNFPQESQAIRSFDDLRRLKAATNGLVVAPHPFYPTPTALGADLDRIADIVDAVEYNALYSRLVNFNRRAVAWAQAHGKPVIGNTDLHWLQQMGTTYSLVDAPADPEAICAAIRAGRVQMRSEPLSVLRVGWIFSLMCVGGAIGRARRGWPRRD
jgi:predicted metal-dependent phosphoesterase TrpH